MRSEREKMIAGEPYDASDPELKAARARARELCQRINAMPVSQPQARAQLVAELFMRDTRILLTPPFQCDYGWNIAFGEHVYFNFNCVILDVAPVTLGSHVMCGPGVHIYTATHPMSARARRTGIESGQPVTIGDDVWLGGGSIVCPGVTIGAGTVIGAGSVVTRSVPPGVFAAGNPCRVIRALPPDEA